MPKDRLCNNGSCEDIGNSHRCHCMDGYSGSYCQTEINECDSAPCQNGATCRDLVGSYSCQCAKGFQGQNCELNVDDCRPNPCQNGGTCHDFVNKFRCSCPPGNILMIIIPLFLNKDIIIFGGPSISNILVCFFRNIGHHM